MEGVHQDAVSDADVSSESAISEIISRKGMQKMASEAIFAQKSPREEARRYRISVFWGDAGKIEEKCGKKYLGVNHWPVLGGKTDPKSHPKTIRNRCRKASGFSRGFRAGFYRFLGPKWTKIGAESGRESAPQPKTAET